MNVNGIIFYSLCFLISIDYCIIAYIVQMVNNMLLPDYALNKEL